MLRLLAGSKVLPWDYTQTIQDFIQSLHGYEEATAKSTEYLPEESCSSLRLLFKDSLLVVKDYDDSPDFAPVYQSLSTLKQSALALREQMNDIERKLQESQSTPTIEKQVDMLNAQCLAFGRALIPLLYLPLSCPSNKVPAIGLPLLPDLACIMQLNKFPVCSSERISIYWEISRILSTINMKLEKIKYIIKENNH